MKPMGTINELKTICGKPAGSLRARFYRDISYYFTWVLLKLGLTANQVSAFGMTVGIISAVLFATGYHLMAVVFFFFSVLSDYSDGEVARYRKYREMPDELLRRFGGFFDAMNHIPRPVVFICLAIYFTTYVNPLVVLSIGVMSACCCYFDSGFHGGANTLLGFLGLKKLENIPHGKVAGFVRNKFYSLLLTPFYFGIAICLDLLFDVKATYYLWLLFALCGLYLFISSLWRSYEIKQRT